MSEIVTALATSAGVLLPVLIFILFASMAAVRRGEGDALHGGGHATHAPAVAGEAAPAPLVLRRELSVIEILLLAVALFGLSMLGLLGLSMLIHR